MSSKDNANFVLEILNERNFLWKISRKKLEFLTSAFLY